METPLHSGRDPVCHSIESLLRDLAAQGHEPFSLSENDGTVLLRFGALQVEAPNRDIAFVRLATVMIDDPRYREAVIQVLHAPMRSASTQPR